jgi:hypothetical protein
MRGGQKGGREKTFSLHSGGDSEASVRGAEAPMKRRERSERAGRSPATRSKRETWIDIEVLAIFLYNNIMSAENLKQQFYKIFANLPLNLREEVILVIPEKGPITWHVAYLEVDNDTKLGKTILEKLSELKII